MLRLTLRSSRLVVALRANEIRGNKAILDFLDKHLKGNAVAAKD